MRSSKVVGRMLTRLKWNFETAADGQQCYEQYVKDADRFPVILMDCHVRGAGPALLILSAYVRRADARLGRCESNSRDPRLGKGCIRLLSARVLSRVVCRKASVSHRSSLL